MTKRKKKTRDRAGDLSFVRAFLRQLLKDSSFSSDPRDMLRGASWFRAAEGILTLPSSEYREYKRVLTRLDKQLAPDDDLSRAAIESALLDAVFATVDIPQSRNSDAQIRMDEAVAAIQELANRKLETYECWLKVGGLDKRSLPSAFGRIRFVAFTNYQRRQLRKRFKAKQRPFLAASEERLLGSNVAIVKCEARDVKAAPALAERALQATIECLNFFSDLLDYNHGWLFLPGEGEPTLKTRIAVDGNGAFVNESHATGPIGGYAIARLRSQTGIKRAVKRVSALLQGESTAVDALLLRAVRWAGRATVAPVREEGFILNTIALECIVLPSVNQGELSHRFSQRIGRMLSRTVRDRREFQRMATRLYNVRSEVIHSGAYRVSEDDAHNMRLLTKHVILTLLTDSSVRRFAKEKELNDWYEDRMMGS